METSHIRRIDDLDLFADCRRSELRKIEPLTTFLRVAKDQVLMRQGDVARQFVIVGDGTARLTRQTKGEVAEVASVGSGQFIGDSALLTGSRLTATATATTDLSVFVSSASEFRSILRIAPSVAHKVRRASLIEAQGSDAAA
jgi:CRP-like cAMP-binding protein